MLYHYADNQFQKNKQMKGKMWADVRLPEETGQEPLCFIYAGTAGRSLDIQVPILGSFSAIILRHLQASAFSILMITGMLGLGIVAISIFLYTRHRQLVEKRFVNVAVFLIICSLWCILDSGIYQMYGKHSAAGSLVSFYAFMLMSVPMLHFIQNTVSKENQWIPEIWILLFYGNAIGQGIVNIWFAVPFKNMLFVTHLILFTGVAAMAILLWREYQKHQTQELELCLKAFGVLGISGVIALALYWMYAIYWYDALFQFGILLFISFLFWGLLCKVSNDIQYRMEQAVYERMSIEDRLGTMGFGYGAAIGAQMALGRQQRVVMFTGDASFHMNLNEACTAVSYELPIITVIFNNSVLGMVRQWQTSFYGKRYSQTDPHRKTDFVKLADGFGLKGYRCTNLPEFQEAFADALQQKGPTWIECIIDKDEKVLPMIPGGGDINDIIME